VVRIDHQRVSCSTAKMQTATLETSFTVTVIIPCYNQGAFLRTAVDSVINQAVHAEIVVINDGSTDNTAEILESLTPRVHAITQMNRGLSAARNRGIEYAHGSYLLFLDADDYLDPNMLSAMLAAAQANPHAAVLHGDCHHVDQDGNVIKVVPATVFRSDVFHMLLERNRMACHSVLVKRCAVEQAGGFDVELKSHEDWDLWLRIAAKGEGFVSVPGAVSYYRRYEGSMSRHYTHMKQTAFRVAYNNANLHGRGCWSCKVALALAARYIRLGLYRNILLKNVYRLWHQGQRFGAIKEMLGCLIVDPLMCESCCLDLGIRMRDMIIKCRERR
jgi:glycosyltransferase involved in cell wall biosynthesis